ncbi:MAG: ABC transporter substrate-binding protein [Candidatus Bipolaricaulota bacterium]|nr:ABC transporter substrate-binding protein [Candidatus Bipolaricaulota bacterium]MDW8126684.1 ABC transporter substrate-binding protein [Candidatus Bipolaricaulota bacterium]
MRKLWLVFLVFSLAAAGVDTIVFVEEPSAAKAVDMIRTGALDLYGAGITEPGLLRQIRAEPNLACASTYNAVWHLSFNPAGPVLADGRLNPFADPRAREAMNWLVDRDYIVQEILGGAGLPQTLPLRPVFPDYARLAQYARPLELRYRHDPDRARTAFFSVMRDLGADLVFGKWMYHGAPVEIKILIRTDARRLLGDYLARLLEDLGFVLTPIYATYAEALRILSAPPEEGLWHIYTNSLVVSLIERDEALTFQLNYTPAFPYPPWQHLRPNQQLEMIAEKLALGEYSSLEEREGLMAQAVELAMRDSSQVWLALRAACYPHARDLDFAVDLAAGLSTGLWARTLKTSKQVVRVGIPALLTAPLNPLGGSFTAYDQMFIRATTDSALIPHPYNGLYLPVDLAWAEVEVKEGIPLQKSSDWLSVRVVPEIPVPKEAWLDWDPQSMRFLRVEEVHPEGLSAKARVVLHFRADLWQKTWHDGSPLSLGDFLLRLILTFDRAKPGSPVYDESAAAEFASLQAHFRGLLIRSIHPFVVEVYTDLRLLDAEWLVARAAELIYPSYQGGPGPWHVLALLLWAEGEGRLTLSQGKAKARGTEWANLLSGPTVGILAEALSTLQEAAYLPYAHFLQAFVPPEEITARYEALALFYQKHGHFWVGNGPFYLELVKAVEKVLVLQKWPSYRPSEAGFAGQERPPLPWVEISGPASVSSGDAAVFSIAVRGDDEVLLPSAVLFVKYLVFAAGEELVAWGLASPGERGFEVVLGQEVLKKIGVGPARLEVIAALAAVAFSAHGTFWFSVLDFGG